MIVAEHKILRLISLLVLAGWWIVMACFFIFISSWLSAVEPTSLTAEEIQELKVDEIWKAVLIQHGKATEWKLGRVSNHPIVFALSATIFMLFNFTLKPLRRQLIVWQASAITTAKNKN
ncbi:MAG: hypothetical protein ABJC04_03800 [Verrucomicrobiota bacterium]